MLRPRPADPPPPFDPKQEFSNRLTRIHAGGLHTNRTLFVGMDDALVCPPGTFARKRKKRGWVMPLFLSLVVMAVGVFVMTMESSGLF